MDTIGIICEYNPFHAGHKKQIDAIRALRGCGSAIVCLMSGNFVQRGAPAILDKTLRARAALRCGADLVLELPTEIALSSAEGFASGGVSILSGLCGELCFGTENADTDVLMDTAEALLDSRYPSLLKQALTSGISFPAARQQALAQMGLDATFLTSPNTILAVEYCKAILAQGSAMKPLPIRRPGSYHDETPDLNNPSATAVRRLMLSESDWRAYVPPAAHAVFEDAALHTLSAGERAMLARFRAMTDEEFEALPYGSEGLWRKFMHACRREATLDGIIAATKSKRYTRTRIDRMAMCAFLGLTREDLAAPAPYVRILGFNDVGRAVLNQARKTGKFRNAGEMDSGSYGTREQKFGRLYGLFAVEMPEPPDSEEKRRVYFLKEKEISCSPNSNPSTASSPF